MLENATRSDHGASVAPREAGGPRSGAIAAAAVIGIGVACGIGGLFPGYVGGASLAHQGAQVVPHVIYLAAWTGSALLILRGGTRRRAGALFGLGTSAVTFGLFFADLGLVMAGGSRLADAGLVLSLAGWLACTAGGAMGLPSLTASRRQGAEGPGQPRGGHDGRGGPGRWFTRQAGDAHEVVGVVTLLLAGLGAAIAFAPSWDSYVLQTADGARQTLTAGNAFANPAPVIAGDIAVMVAVVAAVVAAAAWRPVRHGAALLAGAIVPLAAQAISALVQLGEPASPAQFGIAPPQAASIGLTISSGVTLAFWLYCACLLALALSCARLALTPEGDQPLPASPALRSASAIAPPPESPTRPEVPLRPAADLEC